MPLRHRIRLSNSNVFSIKLRFSAYRLGIQFNSKPSKLLIIWNWSVINVVLLLPIKYLLCASILCGFTCIEGSLSDVIEDTWKEKCKMREHRHNSSAISDRIWIVCCIRSKSVDSRTHCQYIQHVIWQAGAARQRYRINSSVSHNCLAGIGRAINENDKCRTHL